MRFLLDTHVLIWLSDRASVRKTLLTEELRNAITDPQNVVLFSIVSIWEVAIKFFLNKPGFGAEPSLLRSGLLQVGYGELGVTGDHAIAVGRLPHVHRDPFDRMLVAQAQVEGLMLITADATIARYPGPIRLI